MNEEALLSGTVEAALGFFSDPVDRTGSGLVCDSADLPVELRRVLSMKATLRHCFVVRVLLGFSAEESARLLRLQPAQVGLRALEAMRWLAGFSESSEHWEHEIGLDQNGQPAVLQRVGLWDPRS